MKILQPFFWGCLISILFVASSVYADVAIIANKSVKQETLSVQDVEMIFLGKINKWDDGQRIRLAVLRKGEANETFLTRYINKTPAKFSSHWKLIIVSGTGYPPKYFTKESDLLDYVEEKEGAIGYVSDAAVRKGVRVIQVK